MATQEPLVRFYDLSGPETWSPSCWRTRYALNFKGIPYETIKLSYPAIKPATERLFPGNTEIEATVPIIEILGPDYEALNDSTPIALLLNKRFTPEAGFRHLEDVEETKKGYNERGIGVPLRNWILPDVYSNSLDPEDGSREYFKRTREAAFKCSLEEVEEVHGKGEAAILQTLKENWASLRDRMSEEDGSGEPTYWDFFDASLLRWVGGASPEKLEKIKGLYGDDTFTKLLNKVEKYSHGVVATK